MAETPWSKFRLAPDTLAALDALAASNGGNRSQALREAVAYWQANVEAAGRANADALTAEEWTLLGHTGDPGDYEHLYEVDQGSPCRDWACLLAIGLSQMHGGRAVVLPSHVVEQKAAKKLAKKIGGWGITRGYALMAALRYFWRHPEAGIAACESPEIWMTPTAKE